MLLVLCSLLPVPHIKIINISLPVTMSFDTKAVSAADSAIVGRWNSKTLRYCEGVQSATGGQSGCLECHIVLGEAHNQAKCPICGLGEPEALPLPSYCTQRESQHGEHYPASQYSVPCSSVVQSLEVFTPSAE
jgi:hypothetical protein